MSKHIKYSICCLALAFLFFLPINANAATVNLKVGQSKRLSIKSGITWSSKDTSVATVNGSGLAKAKAAGTTKIVGKKGSTTYTYSIVVKTLTTTTNTYMTSIKNTAAGTVLADSKINFSKESQYFKSYTISDSVYKRIKGKSFDPKGKVKRSDLRYLKMLHYNWNGEIQVGEMIVNKAIAAKVCTAFQKLFDEEYPIYSMHLIEKFWKGTGAKSDTYSCKMNNTSAFCYRTITGTSKKLSNHAYGYAIDVNPKQNPYCTKKNGKWTTTQSNATAYVSRTKLKKGMISHSDYAYKLLKKRGFKWGGDWKSLKDYQHFEYAN